MVAKIRAAVAARKSADFTIIARTDARAIEGLSNALERAQRYKEAGADAIFVEAPESEQEIESIADTLRGVPLVFNWVEGGKTPPIAYDRLRELGFRVIIFPISPLLAAARAIGDLLQRLKQDGTPAAVMNQMMSFQHFVEFVGVPEIRDLERRFGPDR